VRTLRMRHGGWFQLSPTGRALRIRGVQLFTADPPGFVWAARVRLAPAVWIDARDMAAAGAGSMRVAVDDVVPVVDARGPAIDQGAALRLLAELIWMPTALFDARLVRWSAIDETHARATLAFGGREVSAVFAFSGEGLPTTITAERAYGAAGELRPWGGACRDWRMVDGMCVPFACDVTWQLPDGPYTYARWRIEALDYDVAAPEVTAGVVGPTLAGAARLTPG
jgi:hypothetical protein